MRRKGIMSSEPPHLWNSIANMARTQSDELLKTLQEGFQVYLKPSPFQAPFSASSPRSTFTRKNWERPSL